MFRKHNRKVRLFVQDGPTIEGVEAGRTKTDHILWCPKIVPADTALDEPVELSGHVEVERARVLYKQILVD